MDTSSRYRKIYKILSYTAGLIIVLLPFHALFTTWLGASFGHLDLFRIWKELLLVPLLLLTGLLAVKSKLYKHLFNNRILRLMVVYVLFNAVLGAFAYFGHRVTSRALIYGLLANARFFVFYGVCYTLAKHNSWLKSHYKKLLLVPALAVIIFGLLQHFVLPTDFLKHAGYGPQTIPAYQAVDLKAGYIRVQSTLRGPNPLGAYLVLVITALSAWVLKDRKYRSIWAGLGFAGLMVLFFSYSRSALLATLLSIGCLVWFSINNHWRKWAAICGAAILLIAGGLLIGLRGNDRFQNIVFHTDEHSQSSASSNFNRTTALQNGVKDLVHEPLGQGPGTAGPASERNSGHAPRISENYYIQIGQELGVVGLAIFITINIYVGLDLWRKRADKLALILFASLIGLILVNLVSHAWADDTLGMLWWGLAGVTLVPINSKSAILNTNTLTAQSARLSKVKSKQIKNEKPKNKT